MQPKLRSEYVIEDMAEGNKVVEVFPLRKYGSQAKKYALQRRNLLNGEAAAFDRRDGQEDGDEGADE
jgi:hypothetical protein